MAVRPFLVLGLLLAIGFAIFGAEIGHAVRTGREFDCYLTVKGSSEREAKANLAIWPIDDPERVVTVGCLGLVK